MASTLAALESRQLSDCFHFLLPLRLVDLLAPGILGLFVALLLLAIQGSEVRSEIRTQRTNLLEQLILDLHIGARDHLGRLEGWMSSGPAGADADQAGAGHPAAKSTFLQIILLPISGVCNM